MTLSTEKLTLHGRLKEISLSLQPQSITAICGPNGAGKSTLLETLAGLLHGDEGAVKLNGCDLSDISAAERAKRIGYLPQHHEIAWDVPVRSLVELGRMPHKDTRHEPVDAALRTLQIEHLAHRRAQSLSGGETARVLLARVLAGEPEWILADEPLAALDLAHQTALMLHLRETAQAGVGVVIVLHDLGHAMNYADRVIVLDRGRVVRDGPPDMAISADAIAETWGVSAEWLGSAGRRALAAR